ncbi:MAG: hypothetical protein H5T86_05450 [Armatimonadetes bacterium]|nr:hypothetical protein [Armatimonadota bacterium]
MESSATVLFIALSLLAQPLASKDLPNGCAVTVDWPQQVSPGAVQEATVVVKAPGERTLTRLLLLVGLNEAAGCYIPTRPPTAVAIRADGVRTQLAAVTSPSWALWPTIAFTNGQAPPVPGALWAQVLGSDRERFLPAPEAVPFQRPDEYDWVTLLFAAAEGAPGVNALEFTVPLTVSKPDASIYVWAAAAGPGLPAGSAYLPVSLGSRQVAEAPVAAGPLVVTSPRDGARVGPSVDVIGRATPGALIVVWTEVYKQETGELVESVPGIRHKTEPDGTFHFRVATPRIFIGQETPLVYRLKVKQITASGESQPVTITIYPTR